MCVGGCRWTNVVNQCVRGQTRLAGQVFVSNIHSGASNVAHVIINVRRFSYLFIKVVNYHYGLLLCDLHLNVCFIFYPLHASIDVLHVAYPFILCVQM